MIPKEHARRLILGTAKFGMPDYGITSTHRTTAREAFDILDEALRLGITRFDTGEMYGDASLLLRAWVVDKRQPFAVTTKVRPDVVTHPGPMLFGDTLLLHSALVSDMALIPDMKRNSSQRIGASVYRPNEVRAALAHGADVVQVPWSVFDRSCEEWITDTRIVTRAPFQQGLLLAPHVGRPNAELDALQRAWFVWCHEHGLRPLVAAWAFALLSHNRPVVFGVDTVQQLRQTADALAEIDDIHPNTMTGMRNALGMFTTYDAALGSRWR